MNELDQALGAVALTSARILIRKELDCYRVYGIAEDSLRQAIWEITHDPCRGELITYQMRCLPRTGVRAELRYAPSDAHGGVRLAGFRRYLSGIPWDFVWWTGDPWNMLSY